MEEKEELITSENLKPTQYEDDLDVTFMSEDGLFI